jgi:lysophospholipase L1-like esterase
MASSLLSRRGFIGKGLMASALVAAAPLLAKSEVMPSDAAETFDPGTDKNPLPILLLVGSSQQSAIEVRVKELLKGRIQVFAPKECCGNTVDVMRKMPEWLKTFNPDIVHIATGAEDLRSMFYGSYEHLIPRRLFKRNVQHIIEFVYNLSDKAVPIWGLATPVNDDWVEAHKNKIRDWTYFSDDVDLFNREAIRICKKMKVKINDLNGALVIPGADAHLDKNGYELNAKGIKLVAASIASEVENMI